MVRPNRFPRPALQQHLTRQNAQRLPTIADTAVAKRPAVGLQALGPPARPRLASPRGRPRRLIRPGLKFGVEPACRHQITPGARRPVRPCTKDIDLSRRDTTASCRSRRLVDPLKEATKADPDTARSSGHNVLLEKCLLRPRLDPLRLGRRRIPPLASRYRPIPLAAKGAAAPSRKSGART